MATLRVLLVLLFVVVTAGQVAVLGLLCVQVVIVCTGKLLTMVARDRIFSVGAAVGLLMVVMRALLRQATTLRDDREAVI